MSPVILWAKTRDDKHLSRHAFIGYHLRCGRDFVVAFDPQPELPMGDRSCETCLRLLKHDAEKAAAAVAPGS